ncbi:MAG: hypothetical protein RJB08_1668 [Actinomycetota bacterium]|jgi:hypothetical protein
MILSHSTIDEFTKNGWVVTNLIDPTALTEIARWVGDISGWSDDGPWLQYYEMTDGGPKICRSENFTPHHAGMNQLLRFGSLVEAAGDLLGEPAVLYKEKINYKLSGGAGFSPHQDAPAYRFVDTHISCMIAIDDSTTENGCLEVVSAMHNEILPMNDSGCIREDIADAFDWTPAEMRAGEVLWFHSRTPHRSGPNNSGQDRRAIFPTYNAMREGDLRDRYYEQKAAEFLAARRNHSTVQVSLIGDFQGRPV